jgi:uncharacterized protein
MSEKNLVVHAARFARALREREILVGPADEVDAVTALTLVDVSDRAEVRQALRVALKIRPRDSGVFDELFGRFWESDPAEADSRRSSRPAAPPAALLRRQGAAPGSEPGSPDLERDVAMGDLPGYSRDALLRKKPFEQCTESDLRAMERLLERAAYRLATCKSRRLVPTRGRGAVDPRRSFRKAVETDGEFLRLARRARAVEEPRLVVLCDTSGSMDAHTRFLLCFLLALKKAARRTEIFVFNTSLTRLTPWLSPARIGPTLERLAAEVPDWSGGTRIGESLAEFAARHSDEMVDGKTVVIVVSDGLDRGDTAVLSAAMRAIRTRARRVIWLNPLMGDPRYEPTARGMEAALPFVDLLASAHNLESLERLIPRLAA